MKKNLLKIASVAALSLALAFGMLSCKKEKSDVKTVIVGTGSDSNLYCYLD